MSSTNVSVNFGGIFLPMLTLLLVAGKLFAGLNLSWWWVLAPTWVPVAIALTVLVGCGLFALFCLALTVIIK